jgi:VWFA-related protein
MRCSILEELSPALAVEMRDNPTWVAVTAFSDELELLLAPSRDPAAVQRALERASERPPRAGDLQVMQRRSTEEVTQMLRNLARSGSSYRFGMTAKGSVLAGLRSYGEALAQDTRETVAGLDSLVQALSFVPGRKAVLLVSDGVPRRPLDLVARTMYDRLAGGTATFSGDDLVTEQSAMRMNDRNVRPTGSERADASPRGLSVEQQDDGGALQFQLAVIELDRSSELDRLAALANTHRVSFYPIKPPVTDAAMSGLGERDNERGAIQALSDMRSGLDELARATGGLAFTEDRRVADFLQQARDDLAAYYSLSFTPPGPMRDSSLREMVLRVRRGKTHLRYRANYLPLSLADSLASRAWGTLLFGWEENLHRLEVSTSVGPAAGERYPVEMQLSLPIDEMELVPAAAASSGAFRVVLQARHLGGSRLEPEHVAFLAEIPNEDLATARGQHFAVRTGLLMPPGDYEIAIGVWEENTAKTSFVIRRVAVGNSEPGVASTHRDDILGTRRTASAPSGAHPRRPA